MASDIGLEFRPGERRCRRAFFVPSLGDGENKVSLSGTGNHISVGGGDNVINAGGDGAVVNILGVDGLSLPAFVSFDDPIPAAPNETVYVLHLRHRAS